MRLERFESDYYLLTEEVSVKSELLRKLFDTLSTLPVFTNQDKMKRIDTEMKNEKSRSLEENIKFFKSIDIENICSTITNLDRNLSSPSGDYKSIAFNNTNSVQEINTASLNTIVKNNEDEDRDNTYEINTQIKKHKKPYANYNRKEKIKSNELNSQGQNNQNEREDRENEYDGKRVIINEKEKKQNVYVINSNLNLLNKLEKIALINGNEYIQEDNSSDKENDQHQINVARKPAKLIEKEIIVFINKERLLSKKPQTTNLDITSTPTPEKSTSKSLLKYLLIGCLLAILIVAMYAKETGLNYLYFFENQDTLKYEYVNGIDCGKCSLLNQTYYGILGC